MWHGLERSEIFQGCLDALRFQTVSWFLLHNVIELGDDLEKGGKSAFETFSPIVGFLGFNSPTLLVPNMTPKDTEHKPSHYPLGSVNTQR